MLFLLGVRFFGQAHACGNFGSFSYQNSRQGAIIGHMPLSPFWLVEENVFFPYTSENDRGFG